MKLATRAALGTAVVALAAQTASAHRSSFTPAASRRDCASVPRNGHVLAMIAMGVWAISECATFSPPPPAWGPIEARL